MHLYEGVQRMDRENVHARGDKDRLRSAVVIWYNAEMVYDNDYVD